MDRSVVRVGVLGCGTVGSAFVGLLARQAETVRARTGVALEVAAIAVRDADRIRPGIDPTLLTTDPAAVVADPAIDVVVEVMGGIADTRALVLAALAAGKPVVTANKALLAASGAELFAAADAAGVDLLFEPAVAGGIPLVRPLRESLLAEPIDLVVGIVNGTTNYILTRMTESGVGYADALVEAQSLGYAEADPTADVGGHDAAAKIAILASIAFGVSLTSDDVDVEGITSVTTRDIAFAARHGFVLKLLAVAERHETTDGVRQSVRVHPTLVPVDHPLAAVRGSFNAVFVHGGAVGDLMFYGPGAGGAPTASAVLGDVVDAAVNLRRGAHASVGALDVPNLLDSDELVDAWYIGLVVDDRPGVLAVIAAALGEHDVSIASMDQDVADPSDKVARIDLVIHPARTAAVRATLDALRTLDPVRSIDATVRVLPGVVGA
ncbi:MAG: homoserine dehydrogenase [Acidimicrobiia bacterium]|nr:homoserine dehydrogenase [Acidimicrobiia bacterium]